MDCGFQSLASSEISRPPLSSRAEIVQILRFERAEMTAPRFDLVDVEVGLDVRGEFGELHFRRRREE